MLRVGEVTMSVFCEECHTFQEFVFTNEEWEMDFWVDDGTPVMNMTCPNCGHCEGVSLY